MSSLVRLAGVQWVKLPVWFDGKDQLHGDRLARFVERAEQDGVSVVGVLDQPPSASRPMFGEKGPLPIASVFIEADAWQSVVDPVMTRLTPIIQWWQLGGDHDASFVGFSGLEPKIEEIRQRLGRFGQKVRLGFAWSWLESPPGSGDQNSPWEYLAYTLGPDDPPLTSVELSRCLEDVKTPGRQRWVAVQPLSRRDYDLATRARDLVERMVAAKIGGADAVFAPRPFDPDSGLMTAEGTPAELFPVWRTTALLLAGTEFLGSIELPGGSRNYIFSRGEDSVMIVWNDQPSQETLYVGDRVAQIDLWDRQTTPSRRDGRHTLEVGPLPTFVTGVNTAVARWRMSFQFSDPRLASVFGRPQRLEYRFQNPFSQGVGGRAVFHTPDVWEVERNNAPLKMAAGEVRNDLLRVTLRPTASSGPQQVQVDFEITADRDYRFSVWRTVDVGLGDVSMELTTRLDEEGRLVVEQHLNNKSHEPVSFLCQLFAPGRPRIRRSVLELNHGRTTVIYHLPDGAKLLGKDLLLRAEEIHGDRALNYRFEAK